MEIKFVDNPSGGRRGRPSQYPWSEFFEELYKHPNKWGQFPNVFHNTSTPHSAVRRFKDVSLRLNSDVDSEGNTIYIAYFKYSPGF